MKYPLGMKSKERHIRSKTRGNCHQLTWFIKTDKKKLHRLKEKDPRDNLGFSEFKREDQK